MNTKKWYKSKTIWIAVLQAIAGILVVVSLEFPDADIIGSMLMLKSVIDVIVRSITSSNIEV